MEVREYRTVDKATWGDGVWQHEPDKKQWQDEATGLPCLIVRGPAGAWCGYVGVPASHAHFLPGNAAKRVKDELAQHIQDAIEDFLGLYDDESELPTIDDVRGILKP